MKRFILAVVFCVSLLGALSSFLFRSAGAAENPLLILLNLPAPPPPNPQVSLPTNTLSDDFFSKDKPPPDNEPIESLMEYWRTQAQRYNDLQYKVYPSEKVLERLMHEIEKDPSQAVDFLNIMPPTEGSGKFIKEMYDKSAAGTEGGREQRSRFKNWLKYNTSLFGAELASEAARVSDRDDYVTNHKALVALARVDWDRASSIANRLYNNPAEKASRTAAVWALYVHAMESGSPSDTDRYRDELKEIVADRSLTPGVRDLALDALSLEKEWSGRDEWYLSMMEDDTLTDLGRFTGLTTLISNSPGGKYIERMIGLLDSDNIAVRSAAAQNLLDRIDSNRAVIVKALVRWLENPKWLKSTVRSGRATLVRALTQEKLPESVPGLIATLDEKEMRPTLPRLTANMNVNAATGVALSSASTAMNVSSNSSGLQTEPNFLLRHAAIEALGFQKDARAAPALRRILNESGGSYESMQVVKALYACGGFSLTEQLAAIETIAKMAEGAEVPEAGSRNTANASVTLTNTTRFTVKGDTDFLHQPANPQVATAADISRALGLVLMSQPEVGADLVTAIIDRIAAVDRSDPQLARFLRKILLRWQGSAINSMLLRDLKNDKIDADAVVRLLSLRKELREKQMEDVSDLRTGGAAGLGISSCILEDQNDHQAILEGPGDEAKIALLACARLIRAPLPVQKVAESLRSKNALLALAAERYLETEESGEAKAAVLSLHPNEAKILGATTAFYVSESPGLTAIEYLVPLFATVSPYYAQSGSHSGEYGEPSFVEIEKRLQEEVKHNVELLGIYNWRENSIRIYKDRAVLSWENDPARYRERLLTKEEFENFKGLLAHHRADELPPYLSCIGEDTCQTGELLMLGRNGGRRLFVKAVSMPPLFLELDGIFEELRRPPSVIKYWASKDVPGLELLFADDRLDAKAIWKSGSDFRLLTADKVRRTEIDAEIEALGEDAPEDEDIPSGALGDDALIIKEKTKREYENFTWNNFAAGALGSPATQPAQVEYIPTKDAFDVPPGDERWKTRAGAMEVRADGQGLYKIVAGKITKIKDGFYENPVITPNGRWVVATKYDDDQGVQLVRVNLLTNKHFVIQFGESPANRAIAFVPSIGRILVGSLYEESEYDDVVGEKAGDDGSGYSLVDPETGSVIPARGEVRPLVQQTFRPLQPAGSPFECWAAIPNGNETVVGLYNTRTFNIKPLLKLPKISFDSMAIWVDESDGKVYLVYEGQLLSAPVKPKP
ncbi:MAG: hypothetical protein ABIO91_06355 [Pyrinomonadaceae bacterium]